MHTLDVFPSLYPQKYVLVVAVVLICSVIGMYCTDWA